MHHQRHESLRVTLHAVEERPPPVQLRPEYLDRHELRVRVGDLQHRVTGRDVAPEEHIHADQPFVTHGRVLHHRAVFHHGRDRRDPTVWKDDIANRLVDTMEDLVSLGGDGPEVGPEAFEVLTRETCEQLVLRSRIRRRRPDRLRARRHDETPG